MVTDDNELLEKKKLANRNIRLALLLAALAMSIYCGYIIVYYFYR